MEAIKSISNMNVSQGTHQNIDTEVRLCCSLFLLFIV